MQPALSVVIPTHKRPDILRECLRHLENQTIADQLEVIVVSDGDDDATDLLFKDSTNYKLPFDTAQGRQTTNYLKIQKTHQGVARNRGVAMASAPKILFIGDDIFLDPSACEKHLNSSTPNPSSIGGGVRAERAGWRATLGFTTWDPAVGITRVMKWLEESGWQFGYPMIKQYAHQFLPPEIQHRFTYTSHVSIPTEIAQQFPFREDVSLYGWEDMEWGLRLAKAGIRLFYEPDARALHHHHLTLAQSLKRMETLGRSAVQIEKIAPELNVVPKGWKSWAYWAAACMPTLSGQHRTSFLRGIFS